MTNRLSVSCIMMWIINIVFYTTGSFSAELFVPSQYSSIQAAINEAGTGDTVLVEDGRYSGVGNTDISLRGKSIIVRSVSGMANCIIDCADHGQIGSHRGFYIHESEAPDAIIQGFTIRYGEAENGGGIFCENASPTIRNCLLIENTAYSQGGGLAWSGSSAPRIESCSILQNVAQSGNGGGLACLSDGLATLVNCTIDSNTSFASGGGVFCAPDSRLTIADTDISYNISSETGGGIAIWDSTVLVTDGSTISHNRSDMGAGIGCHLHDRSEIRDCWIRDNEAASYGGGIYCVQSSSPTIRNSRMTGNSAGISGGGIALDQQSHPIIGGSEEYANYFSQNAAVDGWDIFSTELLGTPVNARNNEFSFCFESDLIVSPNRNFDLTGSVSTECIPIYDDVYVSVTGDDGNTGTSWTNAFRTIQHALQVTIGTQSNPRVIYLGAGTFITSGTAIPMMSYVSFMGSGRDQTVIDGQNQSAVLSLRNDIGIALYDLTLTGGNAELGGAVQAHNSSFGMDGCQLTANTGERAGAIYASRSDLNVMDSLISGNRGSGIFLDSGSALSIQRSAFSANTALAGAAIHLSNEAILTMSDSMVSENQAENGAGLYSHNSRAVIQNCLFESNHAADTGGAIVTQGGVHTIQQSRFTDNQALYGGAVAMDYDSSILFGGDVSMRNYFGGNRAGSGADLFYSSSLFPEEPFDAGFNTFAGYCRSDYYVEPPDVFDFTNCISETVPIMQDVYVSPDGSDENNGLTPDQPFKTIQHALSMIYATPENPLRIHLASGKYAPSATSERFPLPVIRDVSVSGADVGSTILDAEQSAPVWFSSGESGAELFRMTVQGGRSGAVVCDRQSALWMHHMVLSRNSGGLICYGGASPVMDAGIVTQNDEPGGIRVESGASPVILNTMIMSNTATAGAGLRLNGAGDGTLIANSIIADNRASGNGGAVACQESAPVFAHCTIADNAADGLGNSVYCGVNGNPRIVDSIIWGKGIRSDLVVMEGHVDISYSDLKEEFPGEGNIQEDPGFVPGPYGRYYLGRKETGQFGESPCIDKGSMPAQQICYGSTITDPVCMSDRTTSIGANLDTGMVDMGAHLEPYAPKEQGVELYISRNWLASEDRFHLMAQITNPESASGDNGIFAVLLDVYGLFFWYPSWSPEIDSETIDLSVEKQFREIVRFDWPGDVGHASDIYFYSALVDLDFTHILGHWDSVVFGW